MTKNNESKANASGNRARKNKKVNLAVINSVDLSIEAFLGASTMTVGELSALSEDSVVELDTLLNQSIDLRLNGVSIAKGELVAVGDKFGVRITVIDAQ